MKAIFGNSQSSYVFARKYNELNLKNKQNAILKDFFWKELQNMNHEWMNNNFLYTMKASKFNLQIVWKEALKNEFLMICKHSIIHQIHS